MHVSLLLRDFSDQSEYKMLDDSDLAVLLLRHFEQREFSQ